MKLRDLIVSTAILDGDRIAGKPHLFQTLLTMLASAGHLPAAAIDSIVERLSEREALATTGIGLGVAIPHTKHRDVTRTIGMLAVCRPPIWFESLDGEATDIIVLYLGPPDRPGTDSRELSRCSLRLLQQLRTAEFRESLRRSKTADEIAELLAGID